MKISTFAQLQKAQSSKRFELLNSGLKTLEEQKKESESSNDHISERLRSLNNQVSMASSDSFVEKEFRQTQ